MPRVERVSDSNTGGGVIIKGASSVFVNGLALAIPNQPVSGHGDDEHSGPVTTGGSSSVFVEGKPVIHNMDHDSCGDKRNGSCEDVFVGE